MMQYLCESCEWKNKRIQELEETLQAIHDDLQDMRLIEQEETIRDIISTTENLLHK